MTAQTGRIAGPIDPQRLVPLKGGINPRVRREDDQGRVDGNLRLEYMTLLAPRVSIGGTDATVVFSGLDPSQVGVYQIQAIVPAGAPAGSAVPLVISIGGAVSNTVTLAIQ